MARKIILILMIIFLMEVNLFAGVEFKEKMLSNGVNLVYKYIPNVKVTSVHVWMKTGSVNETEEINGISHFLEHLVFKGTKKYKPDEIDSIVESKGGLMNAATSKDYTFYFITIPSFNAEVAFDVISEMVFNATFIKEEIDKERPVVIQEIKRKYDYPTYDMWKFISDTLYRGTPYSREIIGTEENIKNFTRQQIVDYYNKYYHPENMTLVVVGDIAYSDAEKLAKKYFNKTKDAKVGKHYTLDKDIKLDKDIVKIFEKDLALTYVAITYPAFPVTDDRYYAADVLSEILSGGENSILSEELKKKEHLVTSISAAYMGQKHVGSFVIYYTCEDKNTLLAYKKIKKVLDDIISGKIDENMLERAKNRLKSSVVFKREKTSSEAMDIGYSYTLDIKDNYFNYTKLIDKVSIKDLQQLAKSVFSNSKVISSTSKSELNFPVED